MSVAQAGASNATNVTAGNILSESFGFGAVSVTGGAGYPDIAPAALPTDPRVGLPRTKRSGAVGSAHKQLLTNVVRAVMVRCFRTPC